MGRHAHKSALAKTVDGPAQEEGEALSGPVQMEVSRVAGERSELPAPVCTGEIEVLLSLTEDLERIRERAQERRHRLGLS